MTRPTTILAAAFVTLLAACGGGDDDLGCDLTDATTLASSDWPSFRHDPANTARIDGIVSSEAPTARCIYPTNTTAPEGGPGSLTDCDQGGPPILTTVIVGNDAQGGGDGRLTIGLQDGVVQQLTFDGEPIFLEFEINLPGAATTPLVGADDSIFVTDVTGVTRRFAAVDGEQLFTSSLLAETVISLNMDPDGVVYTGTLGGLFTATCPNGGFRFSAALGSISIPAAIFSDPTDTDPSDDDDVVILAASSSGRITALEEEDGEVFFTFFTSGRLDQSGIVVDVGRELFIVTDSQSQIFAASIRDGRPHDNQGNSLTPYRVARCLASGGPCRRDTECEDVCEDSVCSVSGSACEEDGDCDFADDTCESESLLTAGALGQEYFYVATGGITDETGLQLAPGAVYAFPLEFGGGSPARPWILPRGGSVRSAPIVVADESGDTIVFGADLDCDGSPCGALMAVRDGALLWEVALPDPVGLSAPSARNGQNGMVFYVSTTGGKVYEFESRESGVEQ